MDSNLSEQMRNGAVEDNHFQENYIVFKKKILIVRKRRLRPPFSDPCKLSLQEGNLNLETGNRQPSLEPL
jgi:hypothetical protein